MAPRWDPPERDIGGPGIPATKHRDARPQCRCAGYGPRQGHLGASTSRRPRAYATRSRTWERPLMPLSRRSHHRSKPTETRRPYALRVAAPSRSGARPHGISRLMWSSECHPGRFPRRPIERVLDGYLPGVVHGPTRAENVLTCRLSALGTRRSRDVAEGRRHTRLHRLLGAP
jgi:hypothetical protein